jgi:peptidyl-prolyl cis-trans isomerase B (cyclophilin B)
MLKRTLVLGTVALLLGLGACKKSDTPAKEKSTPADDQTPAAMDGKGARLDEMAPAAMDGEGAGTMEAMGDLPDPAPGKPVKVRLTTTLGDIVVQLDHEKAPITVKNFLRYVDEKFYDGTIFHRVMADFMIQGGGFLESLEQKATHEQIKNEADNGLSNRRGTIAMARTPVVDSASAQFFINVVDNQKLDHKGPGPRFGYAVFGRVVAGMDVVDKIRRTPVQEKSEQFATIPTTAVVIRKAVREP